MCFSSLVEGRFAEARWAAKVVISFLALAARRLCGKQDALLINPVLITPGTYYHLKPSKCRNNGRAKPVSTWFSISWLKAVG